MTNNKEKSSLSLVNYLTGISDGLLLPIIPIALAVLYFGNNFLKAFIWFNIATFIGSLAYGFARFLGEKEEIKHNHPEIAKKELFEDRERLKHIGIEEHLVNDMIVQVGEEQELWLKEVRDNDLGWETFSYQRARKAGMQTGFGFLIGAYLMALPFLLLFVKVYPIVLFIVAELSLMFLFGWLKGKYIYNTPLRSAVSLLLMGILVLLILVVVVSFMTSLSWSFS